MLEPLTHTEEVFRGRQGRGAWARFTHGQEAAVLEAEFAKEVRELLELQAGTQLPITIPELLALILWERSTSKPESYELKCWLIELIIVQSSEFSHNEPRVLMKAFSWAGGFDDEVAIYVPDSVLLILARESSLECLLPTENLSEFCPSFLKAEANLVEAEILKMLGVRCPSQGQRTFWPVYQGVLMGFFSFSVLFWIFKYLGNLYSLIIL